MSTPPPLKRDEPAIHVANLYRTFGAHQAVNGVSFTVEHGQVVGFVGANGAGKTTTMRILATLDYPTSGYARVGGFHTIHHPQDVRRLPGWMPDAFGTYEHMTVLEYLDFYARALGYRGPERVRRLREVIDFTDLGPLADRLIDKLSKGQTQRLGLGRALLHDPQILIMDEPAAGLDPKARVELKHLIRILAEEGKTILISSHILSELGEMCDSLLFIDKGRIVHHGNAEDLKRGGKSETVVLVEVADEPGKVSEWALTAKHVTLMESTKQGARLKIDSTDDGVIAGVLQRLVLDGVAVVDFHREERRLEDAFIDILGELEKGTFVAPTSGPPPLRAAGPLPAGLPPLPAVDDRPTFLAPPPGGSA